MSNKYHRNKASMLPQNSAWESSRSWQRRAAVSWSFKLQFQVSLTFNSLCLVHVAWFFVLQKWCFASGTFPHYQISSVIYLNREGRGLSKGGRGRVAQVYLKLHWSSAFVVTPLSIKSMMTTNRQWFKNLKYVFPLPQPLTKTILSNLSPARKAWEQIHFSFINSLHATKHTRRFFFLFFHGSAYFHVLLLITLCWSNVLVTIIILYSSIVLVTISLNDQCHKCSQMTASLLFGWAMRGIHAQSSIHWCCGIL